MDEVQVSLIQQAMESNAVEVTVLSTGTENWSQTKKAVAYVAAGSSVTIRIDVSWYDGAITVFENGVEKTTLHHDRGYITYTTSVSADTTIEFRGGGNTYEGIEFSNYTMPHYVPIGKPGVYGGPVPLKKEDGWSYTWNDLPKEDGSGNRYYYRVQEVTEVPGFHVIYSKNNADGVQAGELVVINQASGYVLPETGGPGTRRIAAAGALLLLLSAAGLLLRAARRRGERRP